MADVNSGSLGAPAAGDVGGLGVIEHAASVLSLPDLRRGQQGQIASLSPECAFKGRLMELGFVPGSLVTVRQKAPLQDPVEYEIRGSRFCLRRDDARHILVTLTSQA